eukprot:scaffold2120_cov150-Skeletonema_dohrnii-CCMP3373.AAC.5
MLCPGWQRVNKRYWKRVGATAEYSYSSGMVPHSKKRQRLGGSDDLITMHSLERLGTDELAHIFGFLPPEDIMRARLNKRMVEAAKKTIVPMVDCFVCSERQFIAMAAMSTALPNIQQITLRSLLFRHKYSDGEDPDEEEATNTAHDITHDIEIMISRFRKLRSLDIIKAPLNGRYPFLFNFPVLEQLKIHVSHYLKFDLEILATGLPVLKELNCYLNYFLTGNLNSLRVLKDTLEKVTISDCPNVQGNFMDLADFPRLKALDLGDSGVIGDIREIGNRDFPALEALVLPDGVYGGTGYEMQHISDALGVIMAVYSFKKQRPTLLGKWYAMLSEDSPDWYGWGDDDEWGDGSDRPAPIPPFDVHLVQAGSRVGYRWVSHCGNHPCEVLWLDPEPHRESIGYETYIEEFQKIQLQVSTYQGFHQPPTEEEHNRLWASEGYVD